MKVSMLVECDSVCELQNTILQMADFCSLTVDEGSSPFALRELETREAANGRDQKELMTMKTADPKVAATVNAVKTSTANYTLEAVRDAMSNLPTAKVRELMLGFGVKKLTDLDETNYPALLAKAGIGA